MAEPSSASLPTMSDEQLLVPLQERQLMQPGFRGRTLPQQNDFSFC